MQQPAKSAYWRGLTAGIVSGVLLSGGIAAAAGVTLFSPSIGSVNGTAITESQLLWYLFQRQSQDVIEEMVLYNILADEAKGLGVTVDAAKADQILAELHGEAEATIFQSLNRTEVKSALIRELTAQAVLKAKRAQFTKDPALAVTDEEIVTAYLQNAAKMQIPEQVLLSVINTSNLKSAESALTALKQGTSFAEVARQYSEDEATKEIGGKIDRPIPKGQYFRGPFKKLDDIAFRLTKGQHSEVIPLADQFFIIQVDDRIAAKDITIEEARPKLRSSLEEYKIAPAMDEWLTSLGEKAQLTISYPWFQGSDEDLRKLDSKATRSGEAPEEDSEE